MKDPVKNYEQYLISSGVLKASDIETIKAGFKEKIESELQMGFDVNPVVADTENEVDDVYAKKTDKELLAMCQSWITQLLFTSQVSRLTTCALSTLFARACIKV